MKSNKNNQITPVYIYRDLYEIFTSDKNLKSYKTNQKYKTMFRINCLKCSQVILRDKKIVFCPDVFIISNLRTVNLAVHSGENWKKLV